ncbi:uncharacterized protein LOC119162384 isoform X1 [Rhipicephalus microplus]|uniref:uncharacterized protein LOC119162384 isoform X1 n=1 Tax=Rhipicephalus microplus TaxID=6941 RepID=UPI003F6B0F94
MAGPRPYSLGLDELQRRLCKLHEEKDLIVTLLDDMLVKVDGMIADGRNLTNMSQFFSYFGDASSMMELVYMKLFKVHVLLTEDTYVDSEQHRVPRMAITYKSHDNSDRYSNSQLAALEAPKDSLSCLPSGSQQPSSPHPSIYDEVLGRQTSAASFVLSQETVAAIPSFTAAYARLASGSPLSSPTPDAPGKFPNLARTCTTATKGEIYAATMPAAIHAATVHAPTAPALTMPVPTIHNPAVPAMAVLSPTIPPAVVHATGVPAASLFNMTVASTHFSDVPAVFVPASTVPTIPSPFVFAPTAHALGVPARTAALHNLTVPTHTVNSPSVHTPAVPALTGLRAAAHTATVHASSLPAAATPVPTAATPAVLPCELAPNDSTAPCSETHPAVHTTAAHTALVHSSAISSTSLVLNRGTNPGSEEYTATMLDRATHSLAEPDPAELGSTIPATVSKSLASTQTPAVVPPVHHPSAEVIGTVSEKSFDQGDAYSSKSECNQINLPKLGACVSTLNHLATPVSPRKSQFVRKVVVSYEAAMKPNFQQQKQPEHATSPCKASAKQQPSKPTAVEIILPDAAVVGTTQGIVISFYKTPCEFWIQLDSSANILEDILKSLQEYYSSSSTQRREITVKAGMYCAAYYADDGRWRRARILQVFKDHVKVFYVDFGNSDRVSMDYLCFLEEEFTTYPAQALWCTIKNMESAAGSRIRSFPAIGAFRDKISAQGKKLQAFFYSQDIATGRYTVDILGVNADNVSVNLSQEFITTFSSGYQQPNNLEALNCATKLPVTHLEVTASKASTSGVMTTTAVTSSITVPPAGKTPPTTTSAHTISQPSMPSGPVPSMCVPPPGMRPVGMPHASTPSTSALPCKASLASVAPVCTPQLGASLAGPPSTLTDKAPHPVGTAPPLVGSAPSPAGMAPPPEGMVPPPTSIAASPDGVTTPATAMAPRPAEISPPPSDLSPAATGMTSSPAGIASPSAESAVASAAVAAMAPTSAPRGSMQPPGLYPAAWHPIYPQLACTRPPAVVPPAILPEGNSFNVCLSVVFNPSDFYGQIVENVNPTIKVLEELHQNLNKCGSQSEAPKEEMVTKGSFWISRYHRDQKWYRARVLDVLPGPTSKCFRVLYLDYGNRCTVDSASLRPLPPELASLPACALRMSLANVCPNKVNNWDEAAIALFADLTGFNLPLVAEKKSHRRTGFEDITEVTLWNTNGPVPINITAVLVQKAFAVLKKVSLGM